jgi:ABC-2 type transport system permease protein
VNQLRSEWIKAFTTRTSWAMIGIGLLVEALYAGLYVGLVPLDSIAEPTSVMGGTGLMLVLTLVLGVLLITAEFRHGTTSSTFLASPRRYPLLAAKLGVSLAVGLIAGLCFDIVNGGLALPLLDGREGHLPPSAEIFHVYLGVTLSFALICAFGMGVGAIVRNQVGAIIAAIASLFILSPLPELLPGSIGDYFPAQALGSLHGSRSALEEGLSQVAGGLVLAAWVLAMIAIGTLLICNRDVAD